jgi:outer membrane protein assembly factor BamA
MIRPGIHCFVRIILLGSTLSMPGIVLATGPLTLSAVHLVGTKRLSEDDVVRGLGLKLGGETTRQDILDTCYRFRRLKLFTSSRCRYHAEGHSISMTITVEDKWGGTRVVFDNFVWMTRQELLTRLKHDLPLFMPELPIRSGLMSEVIRVLQQVAAEHGIKARVRYDSTYWTGRGLNVFYIEGISTPVRSFQIEGENAPPAAEGLKWSQFYTKENFSAAMLTRVIGSVLRNLYTPRGYLRAAAGDPIIQPLAEKGGSYPVRVILPVVSGSVFTFESVRFEGLAKDHSTSLLANWKLKPGAAYNTAYVASFINSEILSEPWAQHSKTQSDTASSCATIDDASKKVSLTITVQTPKETYPQKNNHNCEEIIHLTFRHTP